MKKTIFIAVIFLRANTILFASDLVLWYQHPAGSGVSTVLTTNRGQPVLNLGGGKASPFINEALAVGNGRIGGLIAVSMTRERIALNKDSLWTGDENPSENYDTMGAYHTSHLFAVYPGDQISVDKTPALAEVAKVTLNFHSLAGDPSEVCYGDVTRKLFLKKDAAFRWNGEP